MHTYIYIYLYITYVYMMYIYISYINAYLHARAWCCFSEPEAIDSDADPAGDCGAGRGAGEAAPPARSQF